MRFMFHGLQNVAMSKNGINSFSGGLTRSFEAGHLSPTNPVRLGGFLYRRIHSIFNL